MSEIRIRRFAPGDEGAFFALNQAWIERYFRMEEKDRKTLGDPTGQILAPGGEILVAEDGARAVERGRWTGLLKNKVVGGDYAAHWERTSEGWRVRGELYVRLYCTGASCTQ